MGRARHPDYIAMIKLFIFDFDGTLCATHDAIVHCLGATFDHYGVTRPSQIELEQLVRSGVGLEAGLSLLRGSSEPEQDIAAWVSTYRTTYNGGEGHARTRLFPGVIETLRELKARGCHLVVVSNKGEESINRALEHFALSSLIDLVVGDRDGLPKKPDPASYLRFIGPVFPQFKPTETMMVGDTAADILYGRSIGANVAWARYGYGDSIECSRRNPDVILDCIEELVDLS
jgi:phosphoglycolate phosphatase